MLRLRALLPALVVSLLVTSVSAASAQGTPEDEQARTHFESGRLYFDRGDYEDALREFEAAYELSHRSALLYNIALSNERLGRHDVAADWLEQYLRDAPDTAADELANLEARIASLRERAAATRAAAQPEPVQAPPPEDGGGLTTLGIVGATALGVGAASLVVFAITGGMALGEDATLADSCGSDAGRVCTDDQVSTLRTLTTVADVTMVTGIVLAAAGAVLLALDLTRGGSDEPARISFAPFAGPGLAGVSVGGSL